MPQFTTPLLFVWPYWPAYWLVCLWVMLPEMRIVLKGAKAAKQPDSMDGGSIKVIARGGGIAMLLAFPLGWVTALRFPAAYDVPVYFAGVTLVILSSMLRRHCFKQLGASFTGDVRAKADQRVVTTGAYSILRHPSYTAGILMNTAFGLALGSWVSTLLLTAAGFLIYSYRIAVEERALATVIGEPYLEFMRTRKRLIPFVY